MKIEIILDRTRKIVQDNFLLFREDSDYVDAYLAVRQAIKNRREEKVVVYQDSLKTWLVNSFKKYKAVEIVPTDITFRKLLAQKWKVTFDIDLSDSEIQRQGLLEIDLEGSQEIPLSSLVCQNFISPYLDRLQFNRSEFGLLLNDLTAFEEKIDRIPRLVQNTLQFKLDQWETVNKQFVEVIQLLKTDISKIYVMACIFRIVKNYPMDFQAKCLDKNWLKKFRQLKINVGGLNIERFTRASGYQRLLNEFSIFFSGIEKDLAQLTSDHIGKVVDYTSGLTYEEFEYINKWLRQRPDLINPHLISKLGVKFKSIIHHVKDEVEELSNFVPPPKPPAFDEKWDLVDAIDWTVEKYLPYKFWLENILFDDESIYQEGSKFADYVCEKYSTVSYQYENMIPNFIFNFKEATKKTKYPIIIILDNFNFKYLKYLKDAFAKYKFTLAESSPYLALMPTMTSIGKMSIMSGKREDIEPNTQKYEEKFREIGQSFFSNHTIKYLTRPGELVDYKVDENELILLNYTLIDKELHESFQKTAIEHKKQVNFLIENLIQFVAEFIRRNRIENDCKIFFISDHGSTLITRTMSNKLDISYFLDKNIDASHRFVELSDKELRTFSEDQNIKGSVFLLEKQFSGDGHNYLIAKGYNRFKDIADTFYVHGGASPEEIIVPGGYFEYESVGIMEMILQLIRNEFRTQAKETLRLRIANPNSTPCRDIILNVYADELPLKEIVVADLDEKSEVEIEEEIRIPGKNIKHLKIHLSV